MFRRAGVVLLVAYALTAQASPRDVRDDALIGKLIEIVQGQQAEIKQQQAQVYELKQQLDQVERRLDAVVSAQVTEHLDGRNAVMDCPKGDE